VSAGRYKVQFTASAKLKGKLELTRDLMRHSHPSGDFGPIIERALDLLIESLMKRRFGARARPQKPILETNASGTLDSDALNSDALNSDTLNSDTLNSDTLNSDTLDVSDTLNSDTLNSDALNSDTLNSDTLNSDTLNVSDTAGSSVTTDRSDIANGAHAESLPLRCRGARSTLPSSPTTKSCYVGRATRRTVLERDGLRCSWVDPEGVRCDARAWLEHDHRRPRGKGGGSSVDNVRLLCRSHNRLAAEREYGREHIERATARARSERAWRRHSQTKDGVAHPSTPFRGDGLPKVNARPGTPGPPR
jgi:hypothetical protein